VSRKTRPMKRRLSERQPGHHTTPELGDALRIVYLMRDDEALFERAAIRWLGRFCLEARDVSLCGGGGRRGGVAQGGVAPG
jgi:hypothetical protein